METLLGASSVGGTGTVTVSRSRTPTHPQWKRPMRSRRTRSHAPATSSSIPSRYQTFFYSSGENKGFNSQATRFADHLETNDIPGPGTYSTHPDSLERFSTSFSRKGAGGLASRKERFSRIRLEKVGPGSYTPGPPVDHQDFNRADTTKNFHCPIATAKDATKKWSPAPNTYNVNRVHTERNNAVTGEAAFKSKTQREVRDVQIVSYPGPNKYEVVDQLVHPSICPYTSAFKSTSARNEFARPKQGPGPADYSPHEKLKLSKIPYFKNKHYLCYSAPALPLPPVPPQPGPGHYEIMDKLSIGTEKDMSGSAFKSATDRLLPESDTKSKPGPGQYDPVTEVRRSYFYNVHSVWV